MPDSRQFQHFIFNLFGLRERYAWALETVDHPVYGEIPKGLDEMIKVYEKDPRYREMERDYASSHTWEMSVWEYVVATLESDGKWGRIEYLNAEGEVEHASEYSAADQMGIMCAIMLDPNNFKSMPGTAPMDVIAAPPVQLPSFDLEEAVAGGGEEIDAMLEAGLRPVGQIRVAQKSHGLFGKRVRLMRSMNNSSVAKAVCRASRYLGMPAGEG